MGKNDRANMCKNASSESKPEQTNTTMDGVDVQNDDTTIRITDLTFSYPSEYVSNPPVIQNATLHLQRGTRCLLLGSNGAGKTTLLNVAGGKHMHPIKAVQVSQTCGRDIRALMLS